MGELFGTVDLADATTASGFDVRGLAVEGRLDNRRDLISTLSLNQGDAPSLSDAELIARTYLRFGRTCVNHLDGDWSLAAWVPERRELFLARDRCGTTALFVTRAGTSVAFATRLSSLLGLPWVSREPDLHAVARLLAGEPDPKPRGTFYRDIIAVLPQQTVVADIDGHHTSSYATHDESNAPAVRGVADVADVRRAFDAAVERRVSTSGVIGVTLSSGLDSASVAVTAAAALQHRPQRLEAITAVPMTRTPAARPGFIADEGDLAAQVIQRWPGVRHIRDQADTVGVVAGIRAFLDSHGEPMRNAGNAYWLAALLQTARARDVTTLLTGQGGNVGLSHNRDRRSLRLTTIRRRIRRVLMPLDPQRLRRRRRWTSARRAWRLDANPWRWYSSIRPEFAAEQGLQARPFDVYPDVPPVDREHAVRRVSATAGAWWRQAGLAHGMRVCDPMLDRQMLDALAALPDSLWHGPMPRWLIRCVMDGRLPDSVRLNQRPGLQGADVLERLDRGRDDLDDALDTIERSPLARHCIDVEYCRALAADITTRDPVHRWLVTEVLLRGISVGLFLAGVDRPRDVRS